MSQNISSQFLKSKILDLKKKNKDLLNTIYLSVRNKVDKERILINQKDLLLKSLSYKRILKRGYAVVRKDKKVLRKNNEIKIDEKLSIELYDSFICAKKIKN